MDVKGVKMADYPKIWFLRHGETGWNAEGRIQGQLESVLTPKGREQAQKQACLLQPILHAGLPCFVSPLVRARQTAEIALAGCDCNVDMRLAEAHAGEGQGLTRPEVEQRWPGTLETFPNALELFCGLPGSEGFDAFESRIRSFMDDLIEPAIVVAHGLLGQVMRGLATGLNREEMGKLPNEQGCIYVLENGSETILRAQKENSEKVTNHAVF